MSSCVRTIRTPHRAIKRGDLANQRTDRIIQSRPQDASPNQIMCWLRKRVTNDRHLGLPPRRNFGIRLEMESDSVSGGANDPDAKRLSSHFELTTIVAVVERDPRQGAEDPTLAGRVLCSWRKELNRQVQRRFAKKGAGQFNGDHAAQKRISFSSTKEKSYGDSIGWERTFDPTPPFAGFLIIQTSFTADEQSIVTDALIGDLLDNLDGFLQTKHRSNT